MMKAFLALSAGKKYVSAKNDFRETSLINGLARSKLYIYVPRMSTD